MLVDVKVKAIRKGILKKKMSYEVTRGSVTYFCYCLIDLYQKLIELGVGEMDAYLLISSYESKYYKVK